MERRPSTTVDGPTTQARPSSGRPAGWLAQAGAKQEGSAEVAPGSRAMFDLHGEMDMSDTNEEVRRALYTIREESARPGEVSEILRREVAELRALILQQD
jgi:hypothetical protein